MKLCISILLLLILNTNVFAQKNSQTMYSEYLKIKNALINSDAKLASSQATELYKSVESDISFKQKKELLETVQQLVKTTDLEKQRTLFSSISLLIWELVKTNDEIKSSIYYQYCPMKKSYWVSENPVIKNPYYGAKMLSCGSESDRKNQSK